jgi:hypothetical protein
MGGIIEEWGGGTRSVSRGLRRSDYGIERITTEITEDTEKKR